MVIKLTVSFVTFNRINKNIVTMHKFTVNLISMIFDNCTLFHCTVYFKHVCSPDWNRFPKT